MAMGDGSQLSQLSQLTIGELINNLREDFPDVSVSKVRFLESQGLVSPDRSTSGYRLYDETDIKRIRFVLQQQRDHFLPLKVIKSKLTLWERGEEPGAGESGRDVLQSEGEPLSRQEFLRRSGLDAATLEELESHGLIESHDAIGGPVFPPSALRVALEARRLLNHGLEARHLRMLRLAAEREAEVLRALTAPLLAIAHRDARRRAEETMGACGEAMAEIHKTLLGARLRSILES